MHVIPWIAPLEGHTHFFTKKSSRLVFEVRQLHMLLQPIFVIGSSYNFALYCLPVHRPIFTREKHHGNRVYLFLSLIDSCCSTKTQICSGSALGTKDEILKTDSSSTIELANYTTSLTTHEALQKPTQIPSLSSQAVSKQSGKGRFEFDIP